MELASDLNNQGIMLLASAEYEKACSCFETAVRMLSLICDDRSKVVPRSLKRKSRSFRKISSEFSDETTPTPLLPRPSDIIHFFCHEQDEEDCLKELMIMQENENFEPSGSRTQEETVLSFSLLESQGVGISTDFRETRRLERQNGKITTAEKHSILPLLGIVSSVVLYNMALAYHLAGLTQNESSKLESACRLYEKARLSLAQTVMLFHSREEILDPLSAVMIDILVLASWNNEGHSAYVLANYERSQHCFESLHTLSFLATSQILSSGSTYDSILSEVTSAQLGQGQCYHRLFESEVFDSLKKKAHFFYLNASCFRNTMSAAAA